MRALRACTFLVLAVLAACAPSTPSHPSSSHWSQRLSRRGDDGPRQGTADMLAARVSNPAEDLQVRVAGRRARASVVDIHVGGNRRATTAPAEDAARDAARPSTGSGVVIGRDGLILTNEHVIRNAHALTVSLNDGTSHSVTRTAVHPLLDLAILKINIGNLPALHMTDHLPRRGDLVVAVGGPSFRETDSVRQGMITYTAVSLQQALDRQRTRVYENLVESTARIEPGFSGGALVDAEGKLVGLNVAVSGNPESTACRGYAIAFRADTREAVDALMREIAAGSPAE